MGIKSITLAASAFVLSTSVNAALVGINNSDMSFLGASEDGFNITLDTSTGLEWLDWSLTLNRSYDDVFAQTQGGNLDGWRYATEAEFVTLAVSAGIPLSFLDDDPGGTHPGFEVFNTLLGSGAIDNESFAISAFSASSGTHALGGFSIGQGWFEVPNALRHNLNNNWSDADTNTRVGSALVRDTSVVPVPAAVWLFGSGLLGLVGLARRKA